MPADRIAKMYETYAPANMSLADRGYVSSIHPLELWVVGYLRNHQNAGWKEVSDASVKERQEVYSWLFNTHRKHAQDKRIAGLIEVEAFLKIHAQWKKMGYPFDSLVPSYATTLGASADRPAALAEMMGIIINGGQRKPVQRIESLHFAKGTPYETMVKPAKATEFEQVISPEVARAVADAIREVVSDGTAKRVKSAFVAADGNIIAVGGKTGTGDQRFDVYGAGGRLIESRFVNRSATFVFNIGERFFGSMTAYVHGPDAAHYDFTSALPVQLLVVLAPTLMPMIDPEAAAKMKITADAAAAAKAAAEAAKVAGEPERLARCAGWRQAGRREAGWREGAGERCEAKSDKPAAAKTADAAGDKPKAPAKPKEPVAQAAAAVRRQEQHPLASEVNDEGAAKPKAVKKAAPPSDAKPPKPEPVPQRPQELF